MEKKTQERNNTLLAFLKTKWSLISFIFTALLSIGLLLMILSDLGFIQGIPYTTIAQNELLLGIVFASLYVVVEKA